MSIPVNTVTGSSNNKNDSQIATNIATPPENKIDSCPTFTTSLFHATPSPSEALRKRRDNNIMGFPQDVVDRGFFLADNDWTCYRRNYFQISSTFSISALDNSVDESEVSCIIEVEGQTHAVTQFLLAISAKVSNSDKKIDLVQHTPKRDKGPQMVPVLKPIHPGGNLNLNLVGTYSNIVTFERIQFKTATANNGKRRAAQQYYVVMIDLYAQADNNESYKLATTTSAPLVVRGRSPGHYADSHERFNPIQMHQAFPNDAHHMTMAAPNVAPPPGMIPGDFNGSFPGHYSHYPPPFHGFPPGSLIMTAAGPSNAGHVAFHPEHTDQNFMVQNIHEPGPVATSTASLPGDKHLVKIEMQPQPSHIQNNSISSTVYHSQELVEGFHLYHGQPANGQPANSVANKAELKQTSSNDPKKKNSETHGNNSNTSDTPATVTDSPPPVIVASGATKKTSSTETTNEGTNVTNSSNNEALNETKTNDDGVTTTTTSPTIKNEHDEKVKV
ncbi:4515_t:CDS:2 [Entrophospora sp. SA101]|nr:4515_t:CDS:2 [Entrophospora sp. SA101]